MCSRGYPSKPGCYIRSVGSADVSRCRSCVNVLFRSVPAPRKRFTPGGYRGVFSGSFLARQPSPHTTTHCVSGGANNLSQLPFNVRCAVGE